MAGHRRLAPGVRIRRRPGIAHPDRRGRQHADQDPHGRLSARGEPSAVPRYVRKPGRVRSARLPPSLDRVTDDLPDRGHHRRHRQREPVDAPLRGRLRKDRSDRAALWGAMGTSDVPGCGTRAGDGTGLVAGPGTMRLLPAATGGNDRQLCAGRISSVTAWCDGKVIVRDPRKVPIPADLCDRRMWRARSPPGTSATSCGRSASTPGSARPRWANCSAASHSPRSATSNGASAESPSWRYSSARRTGCGCRTKHGSFGLASSRPRLEGPSSNDTGRPDDFAAALLAPLRSAVTSYLPAPEHLPLAGQLATAAMDAHRHYQRADYNGAARLLPRLVGAVQSGVRGSTGAEQLSVLRAGASVYLATSKLAGKAGDYELSLCTADRAAHCAALADDRPLSGRVTRKVVFAGQVGGSRVSVLVRCGW